MKMTVEEYTVLSEEYAGFCTACDEVTQDSGVEPDAQGYRCPVCGKYTLMGVEQAMLTGDLEFED